MKRADYIKKMRAAAIMEHGARYAKCDNPISFKVNDTVTAITPYCTDYTKGIVAEIGARSKCYTVFILPDEGCQDFEWWELDARKPDNEDIKVLNEWKRQKQSNCVHPYPKVNKVDGELVCGECKSKLINPVEAE